MLARQGFGWIILALLAGLLPAVLLAGHVTRTALEGAAMVRLTAQATALAEALRAPEPPQLPPDAVLISPTGRRLAGEGAPMADALLRDAAARLARQPPAASLELASPEGLLAVRPMRGPDGAVLAAVALWQPAARVEARVATVLLGGLRNAALLLLLCLPAAWVGARLLLAPLAAAALGGAALLDALRAADGLAEEQETPLAAAPVLAAAAFGTEPMVIAAAEAAAGMMASLDAAAAAMLRQEAEAVLA